MSSSKPSEHLPAPNATRWISLNDDSHVQSESEQQCPNSACNLSTRVTFTGNRYDNRFGLEMMRSTAGTEVSCSCGQSYLALNPAYDPRLANEGLSRTCRSAGTNCTHWKPGYDVVYAATYSHARRIQVSEGRQQSSQGHFGFGRASLPTYSFVGRSTAVEDCSDVDKEVQDKLQRHMTITQSLLVPHTRTVFGETESGDRLKTVRTELVPENTRKTAVYPIQLPAWQEYIQGMKRSLAGKRRQEVGRSAQTPTSSAAQATPGQQSENADTITGFGSPEYPLPASAPASYGGDFGKYPALPGSIGWSVPQSEDVIPSDLASGWNEVDLAGHSTLPAPENFTSLIPTEPAESNLSLSQFPGVPGFYGHNPPQVNYDISSGLHPSGPPQGYSGVELEGSETNASNVGGSKGSLRDRIRRKFRRQKDFDPST